MSLIEDILSVSSELDCGSSVRVSYEKRRRSDKGAQRGWETTKCLPFVVDARSEPCALRLTDCRVLFCTKEEASVSEPSWERGEKKIFISPNSVQPRLKRYLLYQHPPSCCGQHFISKIIDMIVFLSISPAVHASCWISVWPLLLVCPSVLCQILSSCPLTVWIQSLSLSVSLSLLLSK